MEFGDFASIAFVLIILMSFLWPIVRQRVRSKAMPSTARPKDFIESGGYTPVPARTARSVPDLAASSSSLIASEEEAVHRQRVEERLTRDELGELGSSAGSEPTAEERTTRRPVPASSGRVRSRPHADQVRAQLRQPESAQVAFVIKEVFDRPVGMRT